MALSKKHYELVAHEIAQGVYRSQPYARESDRDIALLTLRHMAHNLAHVFAADNPRFDRERFLKACGF